MNNMQRRDFLRIGGAAGLAAGLGSVALGKEKQKPIRLGVIGVGGRARYLLKLALRENVEVPALCDINEKHFNMAADIVAKKRDGHKPVGYLNGPTDYKRMLQRDDLDAVIIGTPMQLHAVMSIDALRASKHVLSEVSGAITLDECWGLVSAAEETDNIYMLAENCCYWENVMAILNMVQQGVFGELTFAECGYVHDCRATRFARKGALTWRGEVAGEATLTWRGEATRDYNGNTYPTHSFGPVAQWMGINRGDRMVSLVAMSTDQPSLTNYINTHYPEGHPARDIKFESADSTTVLIQTANGALIDVRYDTKSPRPGSLYYSLQGVTGCYDSRIKKIWIDGRSKGWEPMSKYLKEFEHPTWKQNREKAKGTSHGGGDGMMMYAFLNTVRTGGPSPIDAYDSAAWSSITPLSCKSIAEGGAPQEIPDFTKGKWETRKA